jgi:hypothetical protein
MGCRGNGLSELWAVGIMLRIRLIKESIIKEKINNSEWINLTNKNLDYVLLIFNAIN